MIFGAGVPVPDSLGIEGELAGYASIAGGNRTIADSALTKLSATADAIAAWATDPSRRSQLLDCTPRQTVDDECAGRLLECVTGSKEVFQVLLGGRVGGGEGG